MSGILLSLQSAAGLLGLAAIAWLISENRRAVPWRTVGAGISLQLLLAIMLLRLPAFRRLFLVLDRLMESLTSALDAGTSFVFGYLGGGPPPFEVSSPAETYVFAFRVLPFVLLVSALSALLWVGMAWALAEGFERSTLYAGKTGLTAEHTGIIFIAGLLLYLLSVAIHYLFAAAESSRAAETRALEAEVAARDAELLALKAQLNPHFLFNSLNSVASLTTTDPAGARDMCIQLGDYLRGTLKEGGSDLQPLEDELAQVRRFLRVESVRYGDRLQVVEEIGDECLAVRVPPLILQPLVENSLKHGIAELVEGGEIQIGARCSSELLTV